MSTTTLDRAEQVRSILVDLVRLEESVVRRGRPSMQAKDALAVLDCFISQDGEPIPLNVSDIAAMTSLTSKRFSRTLQYMRDVMASHSVTIITTPVPRSVSSTRWVYSLTDSEAEHIAGTVWTRKRINREIHTVRSMASSIVHANRASSKAGQRAKAVLTHLTRAAEDWQMMMDELGEGEQ